MDCHPIHYDTKIELIHQLTISDRMYYYPRILYSIEIDDLKENDILSVTSAYEVTNEHKFDVMIASNISFTQYIAEPSGMILDESRGYNISHAMHHAVMTHTRQFKLTRDYPGKNFINTVLWSASPMANKNLRDTLVIDKGYGHLDAVVTRCEDK